MLSHINSQIFMLGWGRKIRQSDGWKRPTTQEIRICVCSKLSQGSMACARIHDSQTCCDASGLSHKSADPCATPILCSAPIGGESERNFFHLSHLSFAKTRFICAFNNFA